MGPFSRLGPSDIRAIAEIAPMAKTLAFRRVGEIVVLRIGPEPIAPAAWADYVAAMIGDLPVMAQTRFLTFTAGGFPNLLQRREAETLMRVHGVGNLPTALVTDVLFLDIVIRLSRWFVPTIAAFAPADLDRALDFIAVPPADRPRLLQVAEALAAELLAADTA
jgi:hypothetical protein